jgi:hypothetical protein
MSRNAPSGEIRPCGTGFHSRYPRTADDQLLRHATKSGTKIQDVVIGDLDSRGHELSHDGLRDSAPHLAVGPVPGEVVGQTEVIGRIYPHGLAHVVINAGHSSHVPSMVSGLLVFRLRRHATSPGPSCLEGTAGTQCDCRQHGACQPAWQAIAAVIR